MASQVSLFPLPRLRLLNMMKPCVKSSLSVGNGEDESGIPSLGVYLVGYLRPIYMGCQRFLVPFPSLSVSYFQINCRVTSVVNAENNLHTAANVCAFRWTIVHGFCFLFCPITSHSPSAGFFRGRKPEAHSFR